MSDSKLIGLIIERSRAFGRELCEGAITYAQERGSWELRFLAPIDATKKALAGFDGFIARVTDDKLARRLAASGKPVVDVFYERPDAGFAIVKEKHQTIGRIAAEHFLDRRFTNFAYCPYGGGKTSAYCHTAFSNRLRRAGFACSTYKDAPEARYKADEAEVFNERIWQAPDAPQLSAWLLELPKPVAVFCPDDLRAWQLMETCIACGISVPSEVAILGLDNDLLICGCTHPMLSSIDPNTREIGRRAAQTLDEMMMHGRPRRQVVQQIEPLGVVARASTATFPVDPPWLSDALVYIRRNVRKRLTAADVFKFLGRSQPIVNRAFRKALGVTVQKEIAAVRIEEAKRLLRTTTMSVTEIAPLAGYSSVAYLMKSFATAMGMTPTQWRGISLST